ncbi:antitoxin VbhA family protein [Stenotrophobium rhamnosiphilum]|uniref:antitoxin VbhA family protein n=1 Tax=Stenotrophobium rhamnosiphilum TaxID=2029166 RepID=UPI001374D492
MQRLNIKPDSQLSDAQIEARREALRAAERSGMMEGLPPASDFAREQGELYALGKITIDEVIAALTRHYSTHSDRPIDSK